MNQVFSGNPKKTWLETSSSGQVKFCFNRVKSGQVHVQPDLELQVKSSLNISSFLDTLPQGRLDKLLDGPLFKQLKETNPSSFKKVFAITGDITLPRLGMSDDDFDTIIENTSVIFHSAATVRFDEELRK